MYFIVSWAAFIGAANAQDEGTSTRDRQIEEITVTGSLIRRTEDSSQLTTVIDVEEVGLQASTNAVEILRLIPTNQQSDTSNTTAGFGSGLTNFANLRSLGAENTLVLLDGRRIVKSPIQHRGVNLNAIPMAAIDRIDVLSDGASAIYGTDAVAGVINFQTAREIQGINVYAHTMQPEAPGGETYGGSLSAGIGSLAESGWNLYVGGTWRERKAINGLDRSYADQFYHPELGRSRLAARAFPANLSQFDASGNTIVSNVTPYPDCDPPETVPFQGGCANDESARGYLQVQNPEEQYSFMGRFTKEFATSSLSIDYFYSNSEITAAISPTQISNNIELPPDSPFFPGNGNVPAVPGLDPTLPIVFASPFHPLGRNATEVEGEADRILAEWEGGAGDYDYTVWALHSTADDVQRSRQSVVDFDALVDGFAGANGAPYLNPFGPQTAEGEQYLESVQVRTDMTFAESELSMLGFTVGRSLFDMPGGSASGALALEYGEEETQFDVNDIVPQLLGALGGSSSGGERDVFSATAELLLPLSDKLETNLAVRYDDYSDFGDTVNPKIMVSYDATENVNLHASYNTGFRAPTLYNVFEPQSLGFLRTFNHNDPVLCPGGVVNEDAGGIALRDCSQQYNALNGGNLDIQPEESTAYVVGLDVRLMDDRTGWGAASFGIDYWDFDLKNVIGFLSDQAIFNRPDRFSDLLVRCSDVAPEFLDDPDLRTCQFPGAGDPIGYVVQTVLNLGKNRASGLDFTFNWANETDYGVLSVDYRGTYVDEFEYQEEPGGEFFSRAGQSARSGHYFGGGPVIEYKHQLFLGWQRDHWLAQLQNTFQGEYDDCQVQCGVDAGPEFANVVDSYSRWNLVVSYDLVEWVPRSRQLSVTAHLQNVFDEDPPFSNGGVLCAQCDEARSDPTGRAFGITVRGGFQ